MEIKNPKQYEYTREILNYDGYVLSVEYKDAYMLMNDDDILNPDQVEPGRHIHFNVEEGLVSEAQVAEE